MIERITKNSKLMGIVTLATFAIVAYAAYKSYKAGKDEETSVTRIVLQNMTNTTNTPGRYSNAEIFTFESFDINKGLDTVAPPLPLQHLRKQRQIRSLGQQEHEQREPEHQHRPVRGARTRAHPGRIPPDPQKVRSHEKKLHRRQRYSRFCTDGLARRYWWVIAIAATLYQGKEGKR